MFDWIDQINSTILREVFLMAIFTIRGNYKFINDIA